MVHKAHLQDFTMKVSLRTWLGMNQRYTTYPVDFYMVGTEAELSEDHDWASSRPKSQRRDEYCGSSSAAGLSSDGSPHYTHVVYNTVNLAVPLMCCYTVLANHII